MGKLFFVRYGHLSNQYQGKKKKTLHICISLQETRENNGISLQETRENNVYVTFCFIKRGNHMFQFPRVFFHWFLLNDTDVAQAPSQIKPCKYDSNFSY